MMMSTEIAPAAERNHFVACYLEEVGRAYRALGRSERQILRLRRRLLVLTGRCCRHRVQPVTLAVDLACVWLGTGTARPSEERLTYVLTQLAELHWELGQPGVNRAEVVERWCDHWYKTLPPE